MNGTVAASHLQERDITLLKGEMEHMDSLHTSRLNDIELELENARMERDEAYRDVSSLTVEINSAEAKLSQGRKDQAQLMKDKKVVGGVYFCNRGRDLLIYFLLCLDYLIVYNFQLWLF